MVPLSPCPSLSPSPSPFRNSNHNVRSPFRSRKRTLFPLVQPRDPLLLLRHRKQQKRLFRLPLSPLQPSKRPSQRSRRKQRPCQPRSPRLRPHRVRPPLPLLPLLSLEHQHPRTRSAFSPTSSLAKGPSASRSTRTRKAKDEPHPCRFSFSEWTMCRLSDPRWTCSLLQVT